MADFSLEQSQFTLNNHLFSGWSDDTDALMFPDGVEIATPKFGADGRMVTTSTGQKGGEVTVKLLANSPSTKFMMNQVAALQNGANITWEGSFRDPQNGVSITMERGTLMTAPFGQTLGKGDTANREFVFVFERIIPDYSASTF